jgi:hypothetical protein
MQFIYSLFWNNLFHFLRRWSYTRSILRTSAESTLCFHITIIPKWDSNSEFGQRSTPFLVIIKSSILQIGHAQGHYGILSSTCVSNLNFEFVWAYIMLEITLIHFQIGHTHGSILILLRDLHYDTYSDYPQRVYLILNFEL